MGEIADAIRRASGRGSLSVATEASLRPSLAPAPPPAVTASPRSDRWVESFDPDPAIILKDGPNAELCRHLALRMRSALEARGARSVAIVSAERGDGKTTVACDLAIALATLSRGREIALVDLDLRKPSLARYLSIPAEQGVEEVLSERATLDDIKVKVHQPAIDVFPAGVPQRAAHELLVLPRMASMIAELEERYSIVIVDTPPAPLVPDANLVLRHVSTCLPVVRSGKTRSRTFRQLVDRLPGDQLVGWILNCHGPSRFRDAEYYYYGEEASDPMVASAGCAR